MLREMGRVARVFGLLAFLAASGASLIAAADDDATAKKPAPTPAAKAQVKIAAPKPAKAPPPKAASVNKKDRT